jgi:hypothetical protein
MGRYPDGSERLLRPGKQFREGIEFLLDPRARLGVKLSPLIQAAYELMTGYRPGSGFGNKEFIAATKQGGWQGAGNTVLQSSIIIGKMFVPMSLFSAFRKPSENPILGITDFVYPSKKGLSEYKAQKEMFEALVSDNKEEQSKIRYNAEQNMISVPSITKSADAMYNRYQTELGKADKEGKGLTPKQKRDIARKEVMKQLEIQNQTPESNERLLERNRRILQNKDRQRGIE